MKKLMTGNEAIARGAWEAGVTVVAAYPGTPSTEITENAAKYAEMYAEWAPNEKVAMEVGVGASIAGARTMAVMKHVGLNVAADPLFTFVYTGVNGGFVVTVADDPGMHSSQDEQDSRHYGRAAKLPVIEPSDSQEAKEFLKQAFDLSEQFDTPVMLRITTRVAHSQTLVELNDRVDVPLKPYVKDAAKYVMVPANARKRHVVVEERLKTIASYAETTPLNRIEWGNSTKVGIIASGVIYQYVKEVMGDDVSVLKLGMTYPLPKGLITEFASKVDKLYVIEELDPFIEDTLKAWGIDVIGKELFSNIGEIFSETIQEKLLAPTCKTEVAAAQEAVQDIPVRPPVMCPGCPHRAVFYVLNKLKCVVSGDIGCYTLGCTPPLLAIDTTICMGASISGALGMEKARGKDFARNLVAVIGDSTFMHSGITGLMDVVYNKGTFTTMILDNRTTGMTGGQHHPGTGYTIKNEPTKEVDMEVLSRALGVERVVTLDPFNIDQLEEVLKEELAAEEPSVIITRRPCVLIGKKLDNPPLVVDTELCTGCRKCLKLGCPGLVKLDKKVTINPTQCNGCGLCPKVCSFNAIVKGDAN